MLVELVPRRECLALGGADSGMPSSSALGAAGGAHTCTLDTFATDPFACELSDLSAKHGVQTKDRSTATTSYTRHL